MQYAGVSTASQLSLECSHFFLFLSIAVLTVFRKRRVHKTVNLLTGVADANPDMVVSRYSILTNI